jgi:hypothetical protein
VGAKVGRLLTLVLVVDQVVAAAHLLLVRSRVGQVMLVGIHHLKAMMAVIK